MTQRSTSPAAGRGAFARVTQRLDASVPVTTKVNTAAHHPDVERLTRAVEADYSALRTAFDSLLSHSTHLAEHDPTHGRRVLEAVKSLATPFTTVHRRVAEMVEHVDDDTP